MSFPGVRQVERFLGIIQWSLASLGVCLFVVFVLPLQALPGPRMDGEDPTADQWPVGDADRPVASFEAIWTRDLRQALIEPKPPPPPKPAPPPPPPPPVNLPKLVATFVEYGQSWALIVDEHGGQRVRTAGQRISSFEIVSVEPGTATVRLKDQLHEIKVPRPIAPGTMRRADGKDIAWKAASRSN